MELPLLESVQIVDGIKTEDLQQTVLDFLDNGWTVTDQQYMGDNMWEILITKYANES